MHYYQKNIADYRKDTCHLSLLEHGIYNMVMDTYYLDEKPIKTQTVMRRLSIKTQEEENALNLVLNDFFEHDLESDSWIHNRIEREIIKYHAKAETNKENGKLGGRPKKTQSVISGLPDETQTKPNQKATNNHKPRTNNQEPITIHQQADKESIFPQGSLSKSIYEQKRIKVLRQMPMMARIGKWFNRKEDTLWTVAEAKALKQIKPSSDDLDTLEKYYSDRSRDKPLRKSIDTLLNNWSGELDRANTFVADNKPKSTGSNYVNTLSDTSKFVRTL